VARSKGVKTEAKAYAKAYREEKMSGKQKLMSVWVESMNILVLPSVENLCAS